MKQRLLIFIFSVIATFAGLSEASASTIVVEGVVTDSLSRQPVPYAAILLIGTDRGILADEDGRFRITTQLRFNGVQASALGYTAKTVGYVPGRRVNIELVPTGVALSELVVKPRKEKYSKKNNPAVDMMRRVRLGGEDNDPRRNKHYSYDKYERITLALNNFSDENALSRRFPALTEHIDTSAITGKPILNIALREKSSHVTSRRDPKAEKEIIAGFRREGADEFLDPQATQTLYEDVLREVDIYGNDISLMQNRFVSPLSRMAPDFYKFYLTDTVTVGTDTCAVLTFVPHNPAGFGFVGRLYVDLADSTSLVRRIEMNVPHDINLNFIRNLRITQEYRRAPDGSRLKMLDDMIVEAGVFGSGSSLYARRVTSYAGHSFEPEPDERVFAGAAPVVRMKGADQRTEEWWRSRRFTDISAKENSVGRMMQTLRHDKMFYWAEKTLRVISTGFVTFGNKSPFDIGNVMTFLSFNDLEGCRLKFGGISTANLSRRFFTRGWVAYGTKDHKWKYDAEVEYSFIDKEYHSMEFPVHSLKLCHSYDVYMPGRQFLYTSPDNILMSLNRGKHLPMVYQRLTSLKYSLELRNNFSIYAEVSHERQESTRFETFVDGRGRDYGHFNFSSVTLTLRYAPGEKFFQTRLRRLPVNLDAPVIQLSHTFGPSGAFGNTWGANKTELMFMKRWWMSAFGYIDVLLRGGHVWSGSPYPMLFTPNANVSYTIQPESFALINPMEFVNDSYASWDVVYSLNGALLNFVPVVKKLKLREVVLFRGIWGHLSDRNNPALHPDLLRMPASFMPMSNTPYMEIGVGLENIFKILRFDYVWRLTYRNNPDAPNSGLRVGVHFTF